MIKFYMKVAVYFLSFLLSMYGLSALDFNRFIKKGRVVQAQILYLIIAVVLAYLFGSFFMAVTYYFN